MALNSNLNINAVMKFSSLCEVKLQIMVNYISRWNDYMRNIKYHSHKAYIKNQILKIFIYNNTKVILSVLAPTDLRRPPDLPESVGFGTFAEKSFSSSETSNSGALRENIKPVITKYRDIDKMENIQLYIIEMIMCNSRQDKLHLRFSMSL